MKNIITKITSMKLKESDDNIVQIIGICQEQEAKAELSVLQLAKIFGSDKKVISEVENDFGSVEYEDKCEEIKALIKSFPNIKTAEKEIEFDYVSIGNIKENAIEIYAEDIVGWNNEGLRIDFPFEIYDKYLQGKKFKVFMTSNKIKFIIEDK
jgi:hypothetical protein